MQWLYYVDLIKISRQMFINMIVSLHSKLAMSFSSHFSNRMIQRLPVEPVILRGSFHKLAGLFQPFKGEKFSWELIDRCL